MPQMNPVRLHAAAPDNTPSRRTSWRDRALCMEVDPELFYPETSGKYRVNVDGERELLAKGVCRRCPVRQECLDYAVPRPQEEGIWGGTTARERMELRNQAAVPGTVSVEFGEGA